MEFIVPQIVGFLAITQPGELELKARRHVSHVRQDKGAVRSFISTVHRKSQRFFIKGNAFFEIKHVEILMVKQKFHSYSPFQNFVVFVV